MKPYQRVLLAALLVSGCGHQLLREYTEERPTRACYVVSTASGEQQEPVLVVGRPEPDTYLAKFIAKDSKYYGRTLPVPKERVRFVGCFGGSLWDQRDSWGLQRRVQ